MEEPKEQQLTGLDYLEAVTTLLQRIRRSHPTAGLWEAADRQWSWRNERSTDEMTQLFWFDSSGEPCAAAITTETPHGISFDPIVLADASTSWVAHVVDRGLAHAADCGFEAVQTEADRAGEVMRGVLFDRGFAVEEDAVVEAWIAADAVPEVSPPAAGYRSSDRADNAHRQHHMTNGGRGHADPEARLQQTSLYRSDLDLVVYDDRDEVAAYGLFWFDPTTGTALVEPMRTEDDHQQRGLARHILTKGLSLLVEAGAERIKICFEPGNSASSHLYLDVGFEPDRHTEVLAGPTRR